MKLHRGAITALFIGLVLSLNTQAYSPEKNATAVAPSAPLPIIPVAWPSAPETTNRTTNTTLINLPTQSGLFKLPVDLKLLVLAGDGTEPGFVALKYFLDYLGLPYEAVILKNTPLPALNDSSRGFYQGIILATGSLGYSNNGAWTSALDVAGWTRIDDYMRNYGVRLVSYYTYPEQRYGMAALPTAISTSAAAPANLAFSTASSTIFPYLVRTNPVKVIDSYLYTAVAAPLTGETTTPLLTFNNQLAGVTHTKADGREFMAFTFDNNPYLQHSLALNYGIFNWATKGIFLGERRIYLTPQNDDFFLANDLFAMSPAACKPAAFAVDPTYDPAAVCPTDRMDSGDLDALKNWQNALRGKAQTKDFRVTHAFNGFGTTPDGGALRGDKLTSGVKSDKSFFWLNHTYDHENLDCYNPVPNSGICAPATYTESLDELSQNIAVAKALNLPLDSQSMVTPNISGLANTNFLLAAQRVGIKYLVSDTSRPEWQPATPNTGVRSPAVASILYIPRRATNVYYNTKSANSGAYGSLPDEFNYFYGPNGIFKIGGPGGTPFFSTNQTYSQIVDRESTTYVNYMLRYEQYPLMFHQSNFIRYSGSNSLFTDVITAALDKFSKISNLPVASLAQTEIGKKMEARMAYNAAGIRATYTPGQGISFTATGAALAPVTGICTTGCVSYGSQNVSFIPVTSGSTVIVPLY